MATHAKHAKRRQPAVLSELAESLTLAEASEATHVSIPTIRRAIKDGRLKAWVPLGKTPTNIGRGPGYRIDRKELIRWFYGDAAVAPSEQGASSA